MKLSTLSLVVVFTFILYSLPYNIHAQNPDHVPGEFIVQTDHTPILQIISNLSSSARRPSFGSINIDNLSADMGIHRLSFDPSLINESDILSQLKDNPNVIAVQFNHYLKNRRAPDDPRFQDQWPFAANSAINADIGLEKAWDITTGGTINGQHDIVIAVIDNGFQVNHPDITDNIYINDLEIPNNGIDDDQNGYIDDYRGWNFEANNDSLDTGDHGLPVAGVIGAKGNNGIGIAGINWDVKILPLLLDEKFTDAGLLASYIYAYKMRKTFNETDGNKGAFVAVTNSSWGTEGYFPDEFPIWCNFYDSLSTVGILNCVATSNNNINVDEEGDIPSLCTSESLIVVTKSDIDKKLRGAYGPLNVDIAAPGENILTLTRDSYGYENGTSFSAPVVSGILGLMYSVNVVGLLEAAMNFPEQTALTMKDILLSSYEPVAELNGKIIHPGIINAYKAILNTQNAFSIQAIEYCPIDSLTNDPSFYLDTLIFGAEVIASGDNAGYRPSELLIDTLEQGRFVPVSMISNQASDSLDFAIWMDTNQDSVFSDNELLASFRDKGRWDGDIFIPENIDSGYYNLRVGLLTPTDSINPCGDKIPEYEYEDYTLYVSLNPLLCQNPPSVDTIMTGVDYLNIMWEQVDSSVAYVFRYRKQGETEWEDEMVDTAKMFVLEDLEECTPYEFQVRSVCYYDTSAYTPVAVFFTACPTTNENYEFSEQISIHPNPSPDGNLTIELRTVPVSAGQSRNSVTLYTIEGRQIRTENIPTIATGQLQLYWPDIPQGLYLIRLNMGDRYAVKKWIKN